MPDCHLGRVMTDQPVRVDRNDAVVILTIDSPETRNSLSKAVADGIRTAIADLGETETKGVLLRSTGEPFCAGGDLQAHVDRVSGTLSEQAWRDRLERTADAVAAVYECPLPTVAAIDGPAFSEGACLALACDVRLATPEAAIGFGFRRLGQAATAGASYLLPRVVGADLAAELLYTGRMLDAETAVDRGLFTRVVTEGTLEDAAASLLSEIATGPPAALQATKRLLRTDFASIDDAMAAEQAVQYRLAETTEFTEGVRAFAERRDPHFGGD